MRESHDKKEPENYFCYYFLIFWTVVVYGFGSAHTIKAKYARKLEISWVLHVTV